ncbi:alpha-2-macroglobulin family protein [Sorangium sp. So ce1000]|uniref:alpha-2-macroglobulin family protein n=1 Tax=Sorangium sp. So ce1000 TaxID=3133325 RepID=UPI003F620873
MPRPPLPLAGLLLIATVGAAATSDAATDGRDAVARGLDLFVHAPDRGAPGATLPVQVLALGFPSAVTLRPLEAVTVEATWDPEHLGKVSAVPPPVRVTTDAKGRAHLDVPIPEGPERELRLLLGVRSGDRQRTRTLTVQRQAPLQVDLHVPDTRVVPGSAMSAWITVQSQASGQPAPRVPVEVSLLEGGVARHTAVVTTDAAGVAMARVPVPWIDEPGWSWTLRARARSAAGASSNAAQISLSPREETPGAPQMLAEWSEQDLRAGDRAAYVIRIRDGAGQPVAGLPVRTWIGPKGTSPPEDKAAWEKLTTPARTDAAGEVRGAAVAPTTVVQGVGTTLRLVARATFEGHELEREATVSVESPTSEAALLPEAGAIVPGVAQRMLLRVRDARWKPVQGTFTVEGDGLQAAVTTDAYGEAEVTWDAPAELGAFRSVGPCAGGVAAAVRVRPAGEIPALASRREPFALCVSVDREATALVRPERLLARAGDALALRVVDAPALRAIHGGGADARADRRPEAGRAADGAGWSVIVQAGNSARAASAWIAGGPEGGALGVPEGAAGVWTLSAAAPRSGAAARQAGGAVLVTPRVLPRLDARMAGGRAVPRGAVDVDLALTDGAGRGLPGTVAAVVVDLHGGGSVGGLAALDTRARLCEGMVEPERCGAFLEGDPALDPLRRAELGARAREAIAPANDPAGSAPAALDEAFGKVLRSLEGAVFEATGDPERLRDVRRRGPGGAYAWNPELMTLVTAAMDAPPETPGGEPLSLADLLSVDPQVTFDHVARRVTRLKLFRILAAARTFRRERLLDPDEPALRDPNALLRRLVRDEQIEESLLLDPWGGTIQFTPTTAPPAPFLTVRHGFALQAPGPDGRIGTGDDVRDPFERVLRSGTPYARAVGEDRLVDAKFDMEVGDATVSAWESLLEELTGTSLGEGLGLSGIGTGGGGTGSGVGFGSGHGRLGGAHRASFGASRGVFFWSPPQRTDRDGRLRMRVPLGDVETTFRLVFVGVPDGATPATATLDVPTAQPLSARVDAGAAWVEGDEVDVEISVRNRSPRPLRAMVELTARGVVALADARRRAVAVDVPAGGAAPVRARVRAGRAGRAELAVAVKAQGTPGDALVHAWDVAPAGEPTDLNVAQLVEGGAAATLRVSADAQRYQLTGSPRLVVERGLAGALTAALEAMDPDRLSSAAAMADAVEVAALVGRWAAARGGDGAPLVARAEDIGRRAVGRLLAYKASKKDVVFWPPELRARTFAPAAVAEELPKIDARCPPEPMQPTAALDALEVEPSPAGGAVNACWDALVTRTLDEVIRGGDRVVLARVLLALAERPHRAALAANVADRLRAWVALLPTGGITLPPGQAEDRSARAVVYAALLRASGLGRSAAPPAKLLGWVGVQRDVRGGYGAPASTLAVVRALLAHGGEGRGPARVSVTSGGARRDVEVGPSGRLVVPLDAGATEVEVAAAGPAVVARLERPALRRWSRPPTAAASPMQVEISWPKRPRAGTTGKLGVSLRHTLGRPVEVDVRIPLPPGVSLAAPLGGVRQVNGVLALRAPLEASRLSTLVEIPVRFALAGKVTAPEAQARVAQEELPRAVVPARPIVIE